MGLNEYLKEAMERMDDCTKYLNNLGNIGHLEWCVGCLQKFKKEIITAFMNDLKLIKEDIIDSDDKLSVNPIIKKWEEKL